MSDYFIFDDIDTRDYEGILVYFNEVDTTPKRVGEFIQIPNRNGSFFLDGGRYEDATHTYDIVALSKEYASDLINALASKVGYCRLEDSFNPDEFYSAVFNSEIEPKITKERDKLTFKVTFTRKPQRWLTSGESAVTVESGDTLTNPTLFEASPLLETEGYGTIEFNGYDIEIEDVTLGTIEVLPRATFPLDTTLLDYSSASLNIGDTLTLSRLAISCDVKVLGKTITAYTSMAYDSSKTNMGDLPTSYSGSFSNGLVHVDIVYENLTFTVMPPTREEIRTYFILNITADGTTGTVAVGTQIINYEERDPSSTLNRHMLINVGGNTGTAGYGQTINRFAQMEPLMGESTVEISLGTIYIDCDLGDAYTLNGTEYASLNQYIDLGSDLPKLAADDDTEFTYDNTITSFKVTPRWWKI